MQRQSTKRHHQGLSIFEVIKLMKIRMLGDYSYGSVSDVKKLIAGNIINCPDDGKAMQLIREGFAEEVR